MKTLDQFITESTNRIVVKIDKVSNFTYTVSSYFPSSPLLQKYRPFPNFSWEHSVISYFTDIHNSTGLLFEIRIEGISTGKTILIGDTTQAEVAARVASQNFAAELAAYRANHVCVVELIPAGSKFILTRLYGDRDSGILRNSGIKKGQEFQSLDEIRQKFADISKEFRVRVEIRIKGHKTITI